MASQKKCLISTVNDGTLPTVAALKAVDITTVKEYSTASVLGLSAPGDGGAGSFYFDPESTSPSDGFSAVKPTTSTGCWHRATTFSGKYEPPVKTVTYSGAQESFVILSGTSAIPSITYYFPPSTSMLGRQLTIKSITTGTVTLQCTGADKIFDTSDVASLTSTLVTGQAWNFMPVAGRFYRIDPKEIM